MSENGAKSTAKVGLYLKRSQACSGCKSYRSRPASRFGKEARKIAKLLLSLMSRCWQVTIATLAT
jgi:hypothetical protein